MTKFSSAACCFTSFMQKVTWWSCLFAPLMSPMRDRSNSQCHKITETKHWPSALHHHTSCPKLPHLQKAKQSVIDHTNTDCYLIPLLSSSSSFLRFPGIHHCFFKSTAASVHFLHTLITDTASVYVQLFQPRCHPCHIKQIKPQYKWVKLAQGITALGDDFAYRRLHFMYIKICGYTNEGKRVRDRMVKLFIDPWKS